MRRAHTRQADAVVIQAGGIVVDQIARHVTLDGHDIHLTTAEYELLRVLVANPERALTHRYLLTTALGAQYIDAIDYLRTLINQIRRKIESEPRRPQRLITEAGIGYRLRASDVETKHQT